MRWNFWRGYRILIKLKQIISSVKGELIATQHKSGIKLDLCARGKGDYMLLLLSRTLESSGRLRDAVKF